MGGASSTALAARQASRPRGSAATPPAKREPPGGPKQAAVPSPSLAAARAQPPPPPPAAVAVRAAPSRPPPVQQPPQGVRADLFRIFNPRSIAVIGASQKPGSVGNQVVSNLLQSGFKGALYPINPTAPEICGVKAYKSVVDIPEQTLDLAVYTVPEKAVLGCARDAAQKGTAGHVVITSGFSEVGNAEPERELVEICARSGGRVIGPNVIGLLLNGACANASFAPYLPYRGRVALVSQSGALLIALDGASYTRRFGCSSMVSLGNMADVDMADTVDYYAQDEGTACIALYIEGIKSGKGRRFIEAGRAAGKPIIALKAGVSAHGAAAAASHTGSLAGAVKIYEAAFGQAKVIRAANLDELLDCSQALSMQPAMAGDNVVVITNGGGIGVLSSDSAELHGVALRTAPAELQEKFRQCMPSFGSPKNPVDITGSSGSKGYEDALEVALDSEWVHGVAILYCETAVTKPAAITEALISVLQTNTSKKPVVACYVGGSESSDAAKALLDFGVPVYDNPEKAMCALSALRQAAKFAERVDTGESTPFAGHERARATALDIIGKARAAGRRALTEIEAEHLLAAYGVPVSRAELARTEEEAVGIARQLGYPVVMKIVSPQILHKSDAGGVRVGVRDDDGVYDAFREIKASCREYKPDAELLGVLVGEMAPRGGTEVIVGSVNDPTFGPTVMFGLGGIFVEVLKDVTFRVAPFSTSTAQEMLPEIRSHAILAGARGERPRDTGALAEAISRFSHAVYDLRDEVAEADANPVMVYEAGKGLRAVDARIILRDKNNLVAPPPPALH
eukprot:m51a1_g9506 acetyl-CoA sythetase (798) ;mRNA; r:682791-685478